MVKILPSILSADFTNLQKSIKNFDKLNIHAFHIDVMDGHFVPNITFGPWICDTMNKITDISLDVHLMIDNAMEYIDKFAKDNVEAITVHIEANKQLHRILQNIRNLRKKAGVSLNPGSSVSLLEDVLEEIDIILIMTVNPGFGGQKFLDFNLRKIEKLRDWQNKYNYQYEIYVDGGINDKTAQLCIRAGATGLITGSYLFSLDNPQEFIDKFSH